MGSYVNGYDAKGNRGYPREHVGDPSYRAPGQPNTNTIERRKTGDPGYIRWEKYPNQSGDQSSATPILHQENHFHGFHDEKALSKIIEESSRRALRQPIGVRTP